MTLRPPRSFLASPLSTLRDASLRQIDDELAQEKASALGRLGRAAEAALARLAAFEADRRDEQNGDGRQERSALVGAAYRALWEFIVQREACGLRDARAVMRTYNVPDEVARLLGVPPERPPRRNVRRD